MRALHGVSLDIGAGEFMALVGPSGCGKTTLLKILAGFEDPTAGVLEIQGQNMQGVPAAKRPTRMVFQKLALFPHKTVSDNIGFPLKLQKVAKAEMDQRISAMLDLMHLKREYLTRYPVQLSGGEQQRVALARALISRPSVLLLDEPMSALDAKLKKSLQAELKKLHRELGTSFVLVTHDLEEAMMLADRICVMRAGEVVQLGTPSDIYYRPANMFVAGFIGSPGMNFLPATVAKGGKVDAVLSDGQKLRLPDGLPLKDGDAITIGLRPEHIRLADDGALQGEVVVVEPLGLSTQFYVKLANQQLCVFAMGRAGVKPGDTVRLAADPASLHLFDPKSGDRVG